MQTNSEMIFPVEILFMIASNLDAKDLGNFRLTSSQLSEVLAPLIAQNGISIMNTSESLRDLRDLLRWDKIANATRKLNVYYGEWPVCVRPSDWKTHHLLYGHGTSNKRLLRTHGGEQAEKAFACYSAFIAEEENRDFQDDINTIFDALLSFKRLSSVVISDMKHWAWNPPQMQKYAKLQDKIWMAPCTTTLVAAGVQNFLLAFTKLPENHGIKDLSIKGAFDPAHVFLGSASSCFRGVQRLLVSSFRVNYNQDTIRKFLQAFPDLVHMSISFQGRHYLNDWDSQDPKLFNKTFWPKLETLYVIGLRITEEELFGATENYKTLRSFTISNLALTSGSWRSFFTRVRDQRPHLGVAVKGELYGRGFMDVLNFSDKGFANMLGEFMKDRDSEWPFIRKEVIPFR